MRSSVADGADEGGGWVEDVVDPASSGLLAWTAEPEPGPVAAAAAVVAVVVSSAAASTSVVAWACASAWVAEAVAC